MTKIELSTLTAKATGLSQNQAKAILESILDQVTKTLKKEGRFALAGLGIFEVVRRAKRIGRNPRTGEEVTIKPHKAVKFKVAKVFKEAVN